MRRLIVLLLTLPLGLAPLSAQHAMGCIVDGSYDSVPLQKEMLTRDYSTLPENYSLEPYAPYAGNQQQYGTCVGWAVAYAARSIAEAVNMDLRDRRQITDSAFSPLFVYANIKSPYDNDCKQGTAIPRALDLLKRQGVPHKRDFSYLCADKADLHERIYRKAQTYKIDDYTMLFGPNTHYAIKIRNVKMSLYNDRPVVISMWLPNSFHKAWRTVWRDAAGEYLQPQWPNRMHAMCVVGYSDSREGGAFLIQNSWGEEWGDKGFVWIPYNVFCKYVLWAYGIYVKAKDPVIDPQPVIDPVDNPQPPKPPTININQLAGTVSLSFQTGEMMTLKSVGAGQYKVEEPLIAGTQYRIYVGTQGPAYVYVLASDQGGAVSTLFPDSRTSAALTYKVNNIALPDEQHLIRSSQKAGTDYLCFLYSSDPLDMAVIRRKISQVKGSFAERVRHAIAEVAMPQNLVSYSTDTAGFTGKSMRQVIPLFVEMKIK